MKYFFNRLIEKCPSQNLNTKPNNETNIDYGNLKRKMYIIEEYIKVF